MFYALILALTVTLPGPDPWAVFLASFTGPGACITTPIDHPYDYDDDCDLDLRDVAEFTVTRE